ncbi:MAG: PaaI family thioesterase [Aureispira sp.]
MKTAYIEQLKGAIGQPLQAHLKGFGQWLNPTLVAISEEGDLQLSFVVREDMLNPMGALHGGAVAAIIDEVLGFQIFLKSEEEAAYVSMTMNIDFLRASHVGDVLVGIPVVQRIGSKTANVTCIIKNKATDKVVAQGVSNFMRVL